MVFGGAERLDYRIVKEAAVTDEQSYRPLGRGELHAERDAEALAQAAEPAEETVRGGEGQVLAQHRSVHNGLVDEIVSLGNVSPSVSIKTSGSIALPLALFAFARSAFRPATKASCSSFHSSVAC